jgi:predicted ATPase
MIQELEIKNFRCLRSVQVGLRPLTILVGPNDTGKSAFLHAIRYCMEETSLGPFDAWRHVRPLEVLVRRVTDDGVAKRGYRPDGHTAFPVAFFQLPSTGVPMNCPGVSDDAGPPALKKNGENVPALLDYVYRRDRDRFDAFVAALKSLVPGLEKVEVRTPSAPERRVDVVIEDRFSLPADYASVGLRLILFFAALAYHPTPPGTILIEEPENGVHPKRLGEIMRLLREVTQGTHGGRAAQVILTTHSPHLLDYVDIEKDQVLVFRREPDGSRTAEPADAERLKTFLDEFMLGEVWYNEGEEGLVRPAK